MIDYSKLLSDKHMYIYSRYYKVCPPFAPSLDKIDESLTQHDLNSIRNIKTKE